MTQPEVTIDQGTLRGSIGTDIRGDSFYKFQGIPYAKPPLGELRFKAPVSSEKWTGIFDATKEGNICFQRDPLKNGLIAGSEDCLVLNVFTKKLPDSDNTHLSPVMFWVHGGYFSSGSGNEESYAPDFLITEGVVVVTINYRLGMFGFLSLGDSSLNIPGNAGLKDQVMALKWVQKNISKFGGDPHNVTIFGESAGGAAVHLLYLSPMSKGLFHKAIAQSGVALNPWVRGTTGISRLAPAMNLEGSDEKTIYNALMKLSKEEILELAERIGDDWQHEARPFSVVVEKNAKEPFLSDEPLSIMASGQFNQVPFMLGYTTCEGMLFQLATKLRAESSGNIFTFESVILPYFGYDNSSAEIKIAAEKLKKFYFGNEEPSEKNVSRSFDMYTDSCFLYGIYESIVTQILVSRVPIYLYRVSVESELNFFKKFLQIVEPGVCHCDDLGYLFKNFATPEIRPGSIEDIYMTRFVKLWTNFAKFGNPTPDKNDCLLNTTWRPVTGPNLDFLDIGKNLIPMTNPEKERINFWKKLFAESAAEQKTEDANLK